MVKCTCFLKTHKRLVPGRLVPKVYVSGRPVISKCGTPTEKVSEVLHHHRKLEGQLSKTGEFLNRITNINAIPENVIMVTADVVGLYSIISHQADLEALREALDKRESHKVLTGKLVKMAEVLLKNNYFQFSDKVYQQIPGTAIDSKFSPCHVSIFMD